MTNAYLLAGLPGAGKSTAADILATLTGGDVLSAGEMIREMARRDGLENPTSEELGEYAAAEREKSGEGFFGEKATGMMLRGELDPDYPIIIDSVRHVNGVVEFREYFTTCELLWLDAPTAQDRLDRIKERGRDDEGDYDIGDLMQRDQRELEKLGTETILESDQIDHIVPNKGSQEELRATLGEIVNGR